jgi:hypothetical protein
VSLGPRVRGQGGGVEHDRRPRKACAPRSGSELRLVRLVDECGNLKRCRDIVQRSSRGSLMTSSVTSPCLRTASSWIVRPSVVFGAGCRSKRRCGKPLAHAESGSRHATPTSRSPSRPDRQPSNPAGAPGSDARTPRAAGDDHRSPRRLGRRARDVAPAKTWPWLRPEDRELGATAHRAGRTVLRVPAQAARQDRSS